VRGLGLWLIVGLVLLHLVLHVGLGLGAAAPDLFVLALLVTGRMVQTGTAAGLGFALGLLEDAFSALSFGANAFAMTVTGIAASRSRDLFVGDSLLFLVVYFTTGKWVRELLSWLVSDGSVRGGPAGAGSSRPASTRSSTGGAKTACGRCRSGSRAAASS